MTNFRVKSYVSYKAFNPFAKIPFREIVLYDIPIRSGVWEKNADFMLNTISSL